VIGQAAPKVVGIHPGRIQALAQSALNRIGVADREAPVRHQRLLAPAAPRPVAQALARNTILTDRTRGSRARSRCQVQIVAGPRHQCLRGLHAVYPNRHVHGKIAIDRTQMRPCRPRPPRIQSQSCHSAFLLYSQHFCHFLGVVTKGYGKRHPTRPANASPRLQCRSRSLPRSDTLALPCRRSVCSPCPTCRGHAES